MSILDVGAALETKLDAMIPSLPTAWENSEYKPVTGTAYQRVFDLRTETVNPTYGDGQAREEGIFQVTLCYPLLKGKKDATTRAGLIRTHFKRGTTMTSNGISVRVKGTPHIAPARYEDGLYLIDVSISYFSYF